MNLVSLTQLGNFRHFHGFGTHLSFNTLLKLLQIAEQINRDIAFSKTKPNEGRCCCFVLNVRHKVATRIDDGFDRMGRIGVAFRQGKEFGMVIGGKQQIEVIVASFDLKAAGL
jgi:hypothetical protein